MIDVVCGVIEDEEGRFLACKRPDDKHLAGLWEFPGGKVEASESPAHALARELQEELGIEVKVGKALAPVCWTYDRGEIRLLPYLCTISRGIPQAIEHAELQWCSPDRFDLLHWAPADLPVLTQIRHSISETPN